MTHVARRALEFMPGNMSDCRASAGRIVSRRLPHVSLHLNNPSEGQSRAAALTRVDFLPAPPVGTLASIATSRRSRIAARLPAVFHETDNRGFTISSRRCRACLLKLTARASSRLAAERARSRRLKHARLLVISHPFVLSFAAPHSPLYFSTESAPGRASSARRVLTGASFCLSRLAG